MSARTRLLTVIGAVVIAVGLGAILAPWPVRLGEQTTGDAELAAQVREIASPTGRTGMTVAVLEDGELRQAGLGSAGAGRPMTPETPVEIGSVTKTMTSSVLADMIDSGDVGADDAVRDLVPQQDWPQGSVGDATLADLASHRSGLPRQPLVPSTYVTSLRYGLSGANPDADSTPQSVIESAAAAPRFTTGDYAYSNLGVDLLGHLLAARAGTDYPHLLQQRLLDPVGLEHTVIGAAEGIPDGAAVGHNARGRAVEPWTSSGGAPSGAGVWSTTGDLARFADQVMAGEAPGSDAAKPRFPAGEGTRIGYGWHLSKSGDRDIVWHNGIAGGCASFVGFDRESGRVVVVISNTAEPVDGIAMNLLTGSSDPEPTIGTGPVGLATSIGAPLLAGLTLLGAARGGLIRSRRSTIDRAGFIENAGWSLFLFAIGYGMGGVGVLPVIGWLAGCALTGLAAGLIAARWSGTPWNSAKRPRLHWVGTGIAVLIAAGTLALTLI